MANRLPGRTPTARAWTGLPTPRERQSDLAGDLDALKPDLCHDRPVAGLGVKGLVPPLREGPLGFLRQLAPNQIFGVTPRRLISALEDVGHVRDLDYPPGQATSRCARLLDAGATVADCAHVRGPNRLVQASATGAAQETSQIAAIASGRTLDLLGKVIPVPAQLSGALQCTGGHGRRIHICPPALKMRLAVRA